MTCRPWWEQCLWRRSWSPDWWSRQGCCSSWEEVNQILMLLLTFNQTVMMGDLRQQDKILSSFFWPSLQSSSERTLKLAKGVPEKSFEFNYLACLDVQFQLSSEEKWDQFQLRFEEDWNIMLGWGLGLFKASMSVQFTFTGDTFRVPRLLLQPGKCSFAVVSHLIIDRVERTLKDIK